MEVRTCRCCGRYVYYSDPSIWVKRGRWVFFYHEKCVKGGRKNAGDGKGNRG